MGELSNAIEVITLFVDDLNLASRFYETVFAADEVYRDEVSQVLQFDGLLINLLEADKAPILVEPLAVASPAAGACFMFTIRVKSVDAVCKDLAQLGVALLNGPTNRPWGRRTAVFNDPSGYVWEIAEEIAS